MSFRPDGYMPDEDGDDFDFGGVGDPKGGDDVTRRTVSTDKTGVQNDGGNSSWPAKQVNGVRRGGFGRPPSRRPHHRSDNRNFRAKHSSSPEEMTTQLPQRRWRTRGTREGRTGQWIAKDHTLNPVSDSQPTPSLQEDLPDGGTGDVQEDLEQTDGIIQYGDIEFFLRDVKMGHLIPLFRSKKVSFADLLTLTSAQLEDLGVSNATDRTTVLKGIKTIHLKKWDMPETPLPIDVKLSGREIPLVLSHLDTHIAYLRGTVQYVSKHMKEDPAVIDPSLESEDTKELLKRLSGCSGSIEQFNGSYHELQEEIHKATDYQSLRVKRAASTGEKVALVTLSVATTLAVLGISVAMLSGWKGQGPSSIFQKVSSFTSAL